MPCLLPQLLLHSLQCHHTRVNISKLLLLCAMSAATVAASQPAMPSHEDQHFHCFSQCVRSDFQGRSKLIASGACSRSCRLIDSIAMSCTSHGASCLCTASAHLISWDTRQDPSQTCTHRSGWLHMQAGQLANSPRRGLKTWISQLLHCSRGELFSASLAPQQRESEKILLLQKFELGASGITCSSAPAASSSESRDPASTGCSFRHNHRERP